MEINKLNVQVIGFFSLKYSEDLKYDHLKSRLFESQFSNGRALAKAIAIVPAILKPDHSNPDIFVRISKGF